MTDLHVWAWDGDGNLIKDEDVVDETDEGHEFYLHHLLHADDVVCAKVAVINPGGTYGAAMRRCDPGVAVEEFFDGPTS